jgi:hypothetical protein
MEPEDGAGTAWSREERVIYRVSKVTGRSGWWCVVGFWKEGTIQAGVEEWVAGGCKRECLACAQLRLCLGAWTWFGRGSRLDQPRWVGGTAARADRWTP